MKPTSIRQFIADPKSLPAPVAADRSMWDSGLTDVIGPALAAQTPQRKVRQDQTDAWIGFGSLPCALLLGPPGTGKTTTLAWMLAGYLIRCRESGAPCRVLVTGFTRSAIGNLLETIARSLGEVDDCGKGIPVAYLNRNAGDAKLAGVEPRDVGDIGALLQHAQVVVGMTPWGIFHMLERGMHKGSPGTLEAELFDVACIDEASQMLVDQGLLALAPLKTGGRLIVAGDDRQLPPIGSVELPDTSASGLGGSIYSFLETGGVPCFALTVTSRLNEPLVRAPADLFYDTYTSAEHVATRRIVLASGWAQNQPKWVQHVLDPYNAVSILLHDGPPCSTQNGFEADLVVYLTELLIRNLQDSKGNSYGTAFWQQGLAVVSPHRAQNALIRSRLRSRGLGKDCVVETVDRIQGQERDTIVLSYTVADAEFAQTEAAFLFSPNRFNVAITRARSKLVILLSRRLLELLPAEEELVDAVRLLREYVFALPVVARERLSAGDTQTDVEIRVLRFDGVPPELDPVTPAPEEPPAQMTESLKKLDEKIRQVAEANAKYGTAASFDVRKAMRRDVAFTEYRNLLRLGRVLIDPRPGQTGVFHSLTPTDQAPPFACTPANIREHLPAIIRARRTRWEEGHIEGAPYADIGNKYPGIRGAFVWCDVNGDDVLWPMLQALAAEMLLSFPTVNYFEITRKLVELEEVRKTPPELPTSDVPNEAFLILNCLEDHERARIELGIIEGWHSQQELAQLCSKREGLAGLSFARLAEHLSVLERHGFLMHAEGRYRSRMAELAREIRHVKQRFQPGDADRRPYLVRSLKVLALDRDKPVRNAPLAPAVDDLKTRVRTPEFRRALDALEPMLRVCFRVKDDKAVTLSGFQIRSLRHLVLAWDSDTTTPQGAVITADTGAGKTEAAGLPVLLGAAADRLRDIQGTRAMFVYPRVRLAANQAARLVGYAAELGRQLGVPLTVGMQCTGVPSAWQYCEWPSLNGSARAFPFFKCPHCEEGDLCVSPGLSHVDRLDCTACGWNFDGWIGTQSGMRASPPAIFLMVTESMHQWPSNPANGRLFGDRPPHATPRALLADEIHLYSHIHGAQVGWAMRRMLARWKLNGASPIAVGMSATLGEAPTVWSALSGLDAAQITHIQPIQNEREKNPRAREYYYFVQPEVESRGKDVAGASTTIQTLMLLAHGMRRRHGRNGGFRALAFVDSIDKLRRLQGDFKDAEESNRLAALRTCRYDAASTCCGEPRTCAAFKNGECWYFAATDTHQAVASGQVALPGDALVVARPISSQAGEGTEQQIAQSDVVWTTSTLEVGYDDPAISLVYQHYAPTNVASFVQRKGRGGRGADDRPISGVTLSAHSTRDSWYFQNPARLLAAADFRVPLNMANTFVRRGHVLCAVLDLASRWHAQQQPAFGIRNPSSDFLSLADRHVRDLFGDGIYAELETPDLKTYWCGSLQAETTTSGVAKWRDAFHGLIPLRLFDPINLPELTVVAEDVKHEKESPRVDIALALSDCAPGRISRRWSSSAAHWTAVRAGADQWVRPFWKGSIQSFTPPGVPVDPLVPIDARVAAGVPFLGSFFRPTEITTIKAGEYRNATFFPRFAWDETHQVVQECQKSQNQPPILDKSHGSLLGFVTLAEDPAVTPLRYRVDAIDELVDGIVVHRTRSGERSAGLHITQLYWGVDVDLVLQRGKTRERVYQRQIFVHNGNVEPVGYGLHPEGVRLPIRPAVFDAFLDAEIAALDADPARSRWHHGQFLRALLMTHAAGTGLSRFEAVQLADLAILAAAMNDQRDNLKRAFQTLNGERLACVLSAARNAHLSQHPQMTPTRVERLLEKVNDIGMMKALRPAWDSVRDSCAFRAYLRSSLLVGMLVRLRQDYVIHGLSENARVVTHARVPFQYEQHADDVLTVCERGNGGDGTTRAFVDQVQNAFAAWRDEGIVRCPNAEIDRVVDLAYSRTGDHPRWLTHDPRDDRWVRKLATEIGISDNSDLGAMQGVLRVIYEKVHFGEHTFRILDLYGEVRRVRDDVRQSIGRDPTEWEVISTVVTAAAGNDPRVPQWTLLRSCYSGLEETTDDGTMSADGLLADQVYRFCSRLCVDGCLGCLHGPIDIMHENLVSAVASRSLLERFHAFTFRAKPAADRTF